MATQTIDYTDKITINTLPIPDNEQWKSGDANEVKDVVNNNAGEIDSKLSVVSTDATLTGDGTIGDPLSVASSTPTVEVALYSATTTGTVILDCSTFSAWYRILTGNTDFQFSNTPPLGETFVKNLQVITTAGESLTFTTSDQIIGTFVNDDTTLNLITISFANYPTIGLYISIVIS